MKSEQQIFRELSACKRDSERWAYLLANKGEENMPPLMLDNDDTHMYFGEDRGIQFDMYIGWSDGVMELLTAIGIKHSAV